MTAKPDLDYLTACRYANGDDPLTVAEEQAVMLLDVRHHLLHERELKNRLPRLPAWPDLSDAAVARKFVGWLLDAGWTPPSPETVAAAKRWVEQPKDVA